MRDTRVPQKPVSAPTAVPEAAAGEGLRRLSSTVLKRNAAGVEVMSDHLDDGEEVVRPDDN